MGSRRPADRRPGLAVYAALVALSAWGGVFGLATGVLDMGHELNHRLPFHSPVFGALGLAIFVGVPATALVWHASQGDRRIGATAVFAGANLIGWIAVELAFIRELSWLQPVYAVVGATFAIVGRRADARLRSAAPLRPEGARS